MVKNVNRFPIASKETIVTTPCTIDELPIPASVDAPEYADSVEMVDFRNEIEAAAYARAALLMDRRPGRGYGHD